MEKFTAGSDNFYLPEGQKKLTLIRQIVHFILVVYELINFLQKRNSKDYESE